MNRDNKNTKQLYFIALIPEEDVCNKVIKIKQDFALRFESKAALKSPPHITIIPPFHYSENDESTLIGTLDDYCFTKKNFTLELLNYKCFAPRVIYINVIRTQLLQQFFEGINEHFEEKISLTSKRRKGRTFKPHMTVAFSDLKKEMFYLAWREYKNKEFYSSILCDRTYLLKHNGRLWEIIHCSMLKNNESFLNF